MFSGHCIHCVTKNDCFQTGICLYEKYKAFIEEEVTDVTDLTDEEVETHKKTMDYINIMDDGQAGKDK